MTPQEVFINHVNSQMTILKNNPYFVKVTTKEEEGHKFLKSDHVVYGWPIIAKNWLLLPDQLPKVYHDRCFRQKVNQLFKDIGSILDELFDYVLVIARIDPLLLYLIKIHKWKHVFIQKMIINFLKN